MITPSGRATGRTEIAGRDLLKWRELAHTNPECRDTQHGKGSPFNGAGLLIWEDADNFLRIERNAWRSGDSCLCYPPLIEYWRDRRYSGANKVPVPSAEFFPGNSTWLKATRRGNRMTVSMSQDGEKWKEVRSFDVALATRLQVGVATLNTSNKPFRAEFDHFQLSPK